MFSSVSNAVGVYSIPIDATSLICFSTKIAANAPKPSASLDTDVSESSFSFALVSKYPNAAVIPTLAPTSAKEFVIVPD